MINYITLFLQNLMKIDPADFW